MEGQVIFLRPAVQDLHVFDVPLKVILLTAMKTLDYCLKEKLEKIQKDEIKEDAPTQIKWS